MATPSKPSSPPHTQPTPPSPPVAEEEANEVLAGKFLSVLKWKYADIWTLMKTIQMLESYGAMYHQDGDTTADAPAGMVTMFTDFFGTYNLRLLLTFLWWTCWSTRRFIFPSLVHWGWYILIILSIVSVPEYRAVSGGLSVVLPYLRMMLCNKSGVKKKLVVKEQDKGDFVAVVQFWRTFPSDFEGKLKWLNAVRGKKGGTRKKKKKKKKKKKIGKPVTIPIKHVTSGTFRPRLRKSKYYVIVSDTLKGLGVLGSSSSAGGATAGTRPLAGQKRKGDTVAAGESKRLAFRRPRAAVLNMRLPAAFASKLFTYLKNFIC
ncbi:hypothetical protein HanPI659440_Chr15g0601671 [Helianthus annuus]|nr:hypothetical protein HanPI659440_Chr15g0601671 [Helianthus annuus]